LGGTSKFIENLMKYLDDANNKFKDYDYWYFSKLDENLDEVYIPYYNPDMNRIAKFKPDFIFWFKKGNNYNVLFVDPKGIKHSDYEHKVDGYQEIFKDSASSNRVFEFEGLKTKVHLLLYTDDYKRIPQKYRPYWFDFNHIEKIFEVL